MEIVGLVQDAAYSEVKDVVPPVFFSPLRQDEQLTSAAFYVRTSLAPEQLMQAVPTAIARLDPNLPIDGLRTMTEQVRQNTTPDRFMSTLSVAFALLATMLAAIGLYGVLAYTVAQRTREFGLRMVLGADPAGVRALVLRQVGWMTAVGGLAGVALAIVVGMLASSMLYRMQGYDATVFATSAVILVAVAFGAGFLPARRASRTDPMVALRYE